MEQQKGSNKLLILIIILVVLVAGVYIWYYYFTEQESSCLGDTCLVNTNSSANSNASVNTNTSNDETANWQTYTNDFLGFSFKYPSGTQVNWYPDSYLAGMVRVVSEANPNKDAKPYPGGVGPGSIGIVSYHFESDLKAFAEEQVNNAFTAEKTEVAGIEAYRVQGTQDALSTRVLGALTSKTDRYYFNYNAATWGIEFDAKTEFADQKPSHDEFLKILESFKFTVPDKTSQ